MADKPSQPKAHKPDHGSEPTAPDDLKTLPLAAVETKLGTSPEGLTQAEAETPG
jgi:H+-transporting ATPase